MKKTLPGRALGRAIDKVAQNYRYRPDEWLRFLVDDVMAGFGHRLDKPWDAYRQEKLGELSGLYAQLVFENPWMDILGTAYMDIASHGGKAHLGQFFTPHPVALMMAQMVLGADPPDTRPPGAFVRVLEPTSGSGALCLATCAAYVTEFGPQSLLRLSITACDLDPLCARMTAAQLLGNAMVHAPIGEIVVYRGNSLMPATHWEVVTHATAPLNPQEVARGHPPISPPVTPASHPRRIAATRDACIGEQLSLFEADTVGPRNSRELARPNQQNRSHTATRSLPSRQPPIEEQLSLFDGEPIPNAADASVR